MLSEKQHIDNYIRKKEEEWSQDSSMQDLHWANMQSLLPSTVPTGTVKKVSIHTKRHIVKILGGFMVVTVITLVTLTAVRHKQSGTTTKSTVEKNAVANSSNTTKTKSRTAEASNQQPTASTVVKNSKQDANHSIVAPLSGSTADSRSNNKAAQHTDSALSLAAKNKPDAKLLLNEFYNRVEKAGQTFTVQSYHDTMLLAAEGTKLTIPANAFVNKAGQAKSGTIRIVLKEYYRYDDIVAAKLSTTSDGEQLVTGGMLHVTAVSGNEELKLAPGKSINIKMPTEHFDPDMQLFMGSSTGTDYSTTAGYNTRDTGRGQSYAINWTPVNQGQGIWTTGQRTRTIKVMDWSIEPRHVRGPVSNTKAIFYVARDFNLSDDAIKIKLREKYGDYYNRIRLRRVDDKEKYGSSESGYIILVDSVDMTLKEAFKKHLVPKKDSARLMAQMIGDSVHYYNQSKLVNSYDFTITGLGWINCDRFLKNKGSRTDFAINLGKDIDAGNFITQLVFTRYKSVLPGSNYADNKLYFKNIPLNEPVQLICVGVKGDKVISCIKSLTVSKQEVTDLDFEETTPDQLKDKLKTLNF